MINENKFVLAATPQMYDFADGVQRYIEQQKSVHIAAQKLEVGIFADGEILPRVVDTIRGQHVFLLHALQHPKPNEALVALYLALCGMRRAAASGVTLVAPYMSYMRQDRKDQPRVPISARDVPDLIESTQIVRGIITVDLHTEQAEGFFGVNVGHIVGSKLFARHLRTRFNNDFTDVVILSPDFGGSKRCKRLATRLGDLPVRVFEKRRPEANKAEIFSVGGDIVGKRVVMFDDMIDTGGTAVKVIQKVLELGASQVYLCATHGIFSRDGEQHFRNNNIQVACTDSIPRSEAYYKENASWLTKVSVVSDIAEAIYQSTQMAGSITKLSEESPDPDMPLNITKEASTGGD